VKERAWCRFVAAGVMGLLFFAPSVFAQDGTRGRVGMGVSISDAGELLTVGSGNTPISVIAPTISVPINITSRFRVEPEVGFYRNSSTVDSSPPILSRTTTSSSAKVGAGAFGVASTGRFTLYYGARVDYLRFTQSSVSGSGPNTATYPTYPGFLIAPAVGGEYFLSEHLSLGGEVQVRFTSSKANPSTATSPVISGAPIISSTTASTHGAFVLRFYFLGSTP
jgi:hypothetical protein